MGVYQVSPEDDTQAIQHKIDQAAREHGTVYFPAGIYRLSRTISLPRYVLLRGAGAGKTVIRPLRAALAEGEE